MPHASQNLLADPTPEPHSVQNVAANFLFADVGWSSGDAAESGAIALKNPMVPATAHNAPKAINKIPNSSLPPPKRVNCDSKELKRISPNKNDKAPMTATAMFSWLPRQLNRIRRFRSSGQLAAIPRGHR